MMDGILERYADRIDLCIQCPDRVVITGTLSTACYADGMTRLLSARHIRIFDYFEFTKPLKEAIRENAERVAREAGLEIEFIQKSKAFRKEERIQEILAERGSHPGLVHVFSAMETCSSYKP
jgi:hypothetical protein